MEVMQRNFKEDIRYKAAKKRVKDIKGFYTHLLVYLIVNLFILVIDSRGQGFWSGLQEFNNYWTAISWGIGLLVHGLHVFGAHIFLGKDWEERKIQELMEQDKRTKWE